VHYSHEVNGELLNKLCAALTRKGLGSPETWEKCRNCVAFVQFSIVNAIGAKRVDLLRRNVEWRLEISDTLSYRYFTGDDDPPVGEGNSASMNKAVTPIVEVWRNIIQFLSLGVYPSR
jgi:hypothetical protein